MQRLPEPGAKFLAAVHAQEAFRDSLIEPFVTTSRMALRQTKKHAFRREA